MQIYQTLAGKSKESWSDFVFGFNSKEQEKKRWTNFDLKYQNPNPKQQSMEGPYLDGSKP